MELFQALEQWPVALTGALSSDRRYRRRDIGEYRKSQELSLRGTPPDPGYSRIDELNDCP